MGGEWRPNRLGGIIQVKHGFAFEGRFFTDQPNGVVLVTPGNFRIGGGFLAGNDRYFLGNAPEGYELNPGDVIVTMTDLSKAGDTLGYSAVVPLDGRKYLHNQRIGKIIVKSEACVSKAFVHWLMRTPQYRAEVLAGATGSTVRHTSPSRIQAFAFNLPPRQDQDAIARILGSLDEKIELNRRMAEALEATARALFKSWFVDFDPVRAKVEGRPTGVADDVAALFPDRFSDTGLPDGWREEPLLNHARLMSGGTPSTSEPSYWNGPIAWASAKDVSQNHGLARRAN
jgi:type I restriction enzyme, S subunit